MQSGSQIRSTHACIQASSKKSEMYFSCERHLLILKRGKNQSDLRGSVSKLVSFDFHLPRRSPL